MGYNVKQIRFYSSDDNKVYPVELPENNPQMLVKFRETIKEMQNFNPDDFIPQNEKKCAFCIYSNFCDRPLA